MTDCQVMTPHASRHVNSGKCMVPLSCVRLLLLLIAKFYVLLCRLCMCCGSYLGAFMAGTLAAMCS